MTDYLVQESTFRIGLEDGTGFLLLESGSVLGPWLVGITDAGVGGAIASDAGAGGVTHTNTLVGGATPGDAGAGGVTLGDSLVDSAAGEDE